MGDGVGGVRRRLGPRALERLLDAAPDAGPQATTVYVAAGGSIPDSVSDPRIDAQVRGAVRGSETGAALFLAADAGYLVLPPFAVVHASAHRGWELQPLRELLAQSRLVGVVLLRLGRYAVGVYRGRTLVTSKTDTRQVHGRHRAGGSSQRRFERRREKQARELYDEACRVVAAQLGPYERELEHVFLGGEAHTLAAFRARCRALEALSERVRERVLDVREPNHKALLRLPDTLWESQVHVLGPLRDAGE